jgi:hypothetical protein
LKAHPEGSFIVRQPGHAFAIVNGFVVGEYYPGTRTRITNAWRIL